MAPDPQRIYYLLQTWTSRTATPDEEKELMILVESGEGQSELAAHIQQLVDYYKDDPELPVVDWEQLYQRILAARPAEPVVRKINWTRWVAAAVIVGLLAVGWWLLVRGPKDGSEVGGPGSEVVADVSAPVINKATIKLADGRIVYLDSASNGELINMNGVQVIKTEDGKIVYEVSPLTPDDSRLTINTLTNPRGSKVINLTLSDGTRVWLNAGSSLRYPASFAASRSDRKVEITGEGYFEVAHDATKPFYVSKGDLEVKVLGTHFNINAYDDEEEIKVTLLKGQVKVTKSGLTNPDSRLLTPGQQAIATHGSGLTTHANPDLDEVMAWKNGLFSFKGAGIETIMQQVGRWYNVDIVFEGAVNEKFYAEVSRNTNVSNLLKMLEATRTVRFKVEEKKITVLRY